MTRAALLALGLLLGGCDPAWAGVDQAPGVPTVALGADMVAGNNLAARWQDLRVPLVTGKVGATAPQWVAFRGAISAYQFRNTHADEIYITAQMPHGLSSSTIKVHAHWSPGDQGNEQIGKTLQLIADCSAGAVGTEYPASTPYTITDTGSTISQIIQCHVYMDNVGPGANNAGAGMFVTDIDFHYQIKALGTVNSDGSGGT